MNKKFIRVIAILFWLAMAGWLIRFEACSEYFTHKSVGYKTFLSNNVLITDSWMKIIYDGAPIGYSYIGMELDENNPLNYYKISSRVILSLNMMGFQKLISVNTVAWLDVVYDLQSFDFAMASEGTVVRMKARRTKGDNFDVLMNTAGAIRRMNIEIPSDVVVYSPMMEMSLKNLKPGEKLLIKTLNPVTMSSTTVAITALRKEKLTLGDAVYDSIVLSSEYDGMKVLSWIDEEGKSLRQETPFGWVLERCSDDEATATIRMAKKSDVDMLRRMSVPCTGMIENPQAAPSIRYRFKGVEFTEEELSSNRQTVEKTDGETCEIVVRSAQGLPVSPVELDPVVRKELTAPSSALQSDDPEIIKLAQKITEDIESPDAKAVAIFNWVYKNIEKKATVSMPSALDVIRTRQGDCNEHTYVYVALARAAGLPSQIKVGLAYHEGAFYYHAWPAVFTDRWLEMDPTWGQERVDATHIALLDGELMNQVHLMKVVGRLKIEVIGKEDR